MTDQYRLTWALFLSVLLHGLLLTLLPFIRRAHLEIPSPPPLLDVDVLPLPKAAPPARIAKAPAPAAPPQQAAAAAPPPVLIPERQIVSPPEVGEEKEPEKTRFLSDRNNTVKEEVVHRAEPAAGDPEAKPAPPPEEAKVGKAEQPAAPKPQSAPKPQAVPRPQPAREAAHTQVASLPKLDALLPPAGDLIREGLVRPEAAPPQPAPQQQASVQRNDLLRHGDPWRTGGTRGGSLDFLPSVREGDITMLNTKAEQFAPFVRRVAVRVFENFRILLRRSIDARSAESVEEYATIEAIMDKQGRLLSIQPKDRSTNAALATDRNLQAATREGFFDRNPPPGAEGSDGNIHFVFDARVGLLTDPGRGVVGYRALFQAGLL
jgi:hypothetical protein